MNFKAVFYCFNVILLFSCSNGKNNTPVILSDNEQVLEIRKSKLIDAKHMETAFINPSSSTLLINPDVLKDTNIAKNFETKTDVFELPTKENHHNISHYQYFKVKNLVKQHKFLLLTSNGDVTVYLNGELIYTNTEGRHWKHFSDFVRLSLPAGENEILINYKLDNINRNQVRAPRIVSQNAARALFYKLYHFYFIEKCIIDTTNTLTLKHPCYTSDSAIVQILNNNSDTVLYKQILFKNLFNVNLSDSEKGIYTIKLTFQDYEYSGNFIYGNANNIYSELLKKSITTNNETAIQLAGYQSRIEHLLKHSYHLGQRKAFFEIDVSADSTSWRKLHKGSSTATTLSSDNTNIGFKAQRFIKIIGRMNSFHTWNSVSEVVFLNGEDTLSPKKVYSNDHSKDFIAQNVLDGDINTFWESVGDKKWLLFDLGMPKTVTNIQIAWKKDIGTSLGLLKWQSNITWVLKDFENFINFGNANFEQSGYHYRSYLSSIDESLQQYMIYVPPNNKQAPLPLVINMPLNVNTHLPFHKCVTISNLNLISQAAIQAKKQNYYSVWFCGKSFGTLMHYASLTELNTMLNEIKKHHNIDTNKFYAVGSCAGANKVLETMCRYPSKYHTASLFASSVGNKVFKNVVNLTGARISFFHGQYDKHSPLDTVKSFQNLLLQNNIPTKLNIAKHAKHQYYSREPYEIVFNNLLLKPFSVPDSFKLRCEELKYGEKYWIKINSIEGEHAEINASQKGNKLNITTRNVRNLSVLFNRFLKLNYSEKIVVSINNKILFDSITGNRKEISFQLKPTYSRQNTLKNKLTEGPINHAFANRFIIVQGTLGTAKDRKINAAIVKQFVDSYYKYYFSYCIIKKDFEITEQDAKSSNLILIGNFKTNSYLQRLEKDLPIRFNENGIDFFGQKIINRNIILNMVYPNPKNKERYIVVYGSNSLTDFRWKNNPFVTGSKDYHLYFSNTKGELIQIAQGNFTRAWQL